MEAFEYKPSELILNEDGSVYHLKLKPENISDTIFLVGDPQRVPLVSGFFDRIEFTRENREIVTHTGYYKNRRLTVISTGMGPDNIDIVINELDALANIDLENRMRRSLFKPLQLIRLGTSGSIREDIRVDDFVLSEYALGLDGLLFFYKDFQDAFDEKLQQNIVNLLGDKYIHPYAVRASGSLISRFSDEWERGITITAPGFYGPQFRSLRLDHRLKGMLERLRDFSFDGRRILNFEMESSALYGLSNLLGHHAVTVCAILANRATNEYSKQPATTITRLIEKVLSEIVD